MDYCLACYQPAFIYNTVRNKNTSVFMPYNEICCVCITHSYQIVDESKLRPKPVLYDIASFFNDDRQQKTVGLDFYPQYWY